MRAIRGAICASTNTRSSICSATRRLLEEICRRNELASEQVIAVFFTMTPDLDAQFPAYAARDMGWTHVAMLGAQESAVPGAPVRAIRVMVLAEGEGRGRSVYLGRAAAMRPDLAEPGDERLWDDLADGRSASASKGELGRLLVVGLGLIGGSVAAAARESPCFRQVIGCDRDPARAARARDLGLVDGEVAVLDAGLVEADIVVLATPVADIVRLLERIVTGLSPGALVTDVGSVKRTVVAAMDRLPTHVCAVAGHPMTGKTASGPDAASSGLFRGTPWALVSTARSDEHARVRAERFVRALGATPLWMDADTHDRAVARSSHLPVLAAVGLVRSLRSEGSARPGEPSLVGPGFRLASRLAAGDPVMTAQMLVANADEIRSALTDYIEELAGLREVIGHPESLTELLRSARRERGLLVTDGE